MSALKNLSKQSMKRGDTIIEVMMAIAIFCMVAVLSVTMMNLGTNSAQNALEVAIARNEINAQAEALRFIHSAYISEKTLPEEPTGYVTNDWYDSLVNNRYQQYKALWETITANAITPDQAQESGLVNLSEFLNNSAENVNFKTYGCDRVYEKNSADQTWLSRNNAFILNTRNLHKLEYNETTSALVGTDVAYSYVSAADNPSVFQAAPLNARILYRQTAVTDTDDDENENTTTDDSSTLISERQLYDAVYRAEGIWVIAVKESTTDPEDNDNNISRYYDFYIESCWYGPNTTSPTTIDTVIRLYNPENI